MRSRYFTLVFFSVLFCISCEDILDQEPLQDPVTSTFYKNENEAILSVNSIYDVLNGTLYRDGNPAALAMMEDNVYKGTNPNDGFGLSQINALNIESTNPFIESWYSGLYLGINRANISLKRIAEIPAPDSIEENSKERLLGEASFLRGLFYFYLVRLYGEVPIIVSISDDPQASGKAKSSEDEVWSQIESDFMDAIDALPETYGESNIGRATSGAAKAFLAQAYVWQNKYDLALPLLEDVMSGNYDLEPNYIDNFLETNYNSPETVFAIQYSDLGNSDESANWIKFIGVRGQPGLLRHSSLPENLKGESGYGWFMYTNAVLDSFDENDIRREVSFWELGQHHPDSPLTDTYDATKSSPFHLNQTDLGPKKWFWAQKSYSTNVGVNLALIRFSDVLLLYAEVLNELNNGPNAAAYQAINRVRVRAGVSPYMQGGFDKDSFFDAVLRERRAEFTHEFQRWWTISRTRTAEGFFANSVYKTGNFNERFYKWPLPQNALDRNPELVQNPNY